MNKIVGLTNIVLLQRPTVANDEYMFMI